MLTADFNANGSLRRFACGGISLNLFVGSEMEGGPTNIYLRRLGRDPAQIPLLGPSSPGPVGDWHGIRYSIVLTLATDAPAWFWQVRLENTGPEACELDLIYAQDLALAPYGMVRTNEYYVSQYVDHTPLSHATHGYVIASRQNLAVEGRHPWCLIGSLRRAVSFGTDARSRDELSSRRLQHEHSMVLLQDAPLRLEPNGSVSAGFFGRYVDDHPEATSAVDLERVPQAPPAVDVPVVADRSPVSLFTSAPELAVADLASDELRSLFPAPWRHEEVDDRGERLSFFHGADRHVVLRAKELRVLRPHGHLLRTGRHLTPDESALTSTSWMSGTFHSMVTQGHVSSNRFLSTVRSYIGLFRSHGQRVFVELDGAWQLLGMPSAFEMGPDVCRWIYRHAGGTIDVTAGARSDPHELTLAIDVRSRAPCRFLISHHVALNGDDGSAPGVPRLSRDADAVVIAPAAGSDLARRFPDGSFRISPQPGTAFERVGGDELLFPDDKTRGEPYICVVTAPAKGAVLHIQGCLIANTADAPQRADSQRELSPSVRLVAPAASELSNNVERLADIVPWFAQNAFVHYLAPRGLEQYSGGGWGTRDVCQGPVELLLAMGRVEPIRDLLLRVMRAQNPDGDWPQWFMFFERERTIRAGDSHGDIVFWPVLALAQYLIASGDRTILDERVPFFASDSKSAENASVWEHAQRALGVIERRVIPGTALAAYGHGDWNDALQPADLSMRERMCSAWTVTLHYQTLLTLAHALRVVGRTSEVAHFEKWADSVKRDFQSLLLPEGVLTGYASFEEDARVRYILHPTDTVTGVRYSALAMIHAILEDMLTPAQALAHLDLLKTHLSGPDGVRLFDRPMPYHGGPQRLFQRAESATFFGREIGLMYMHAHLRYAQALAHVGEAEGFFKALCQANPIGIRELVPSATLRQANCYYSSSDAAFDDRYQASAEYDRVARGTVPLDGGWRVYSSGAGIALGLIVRRFLGLNREADAVTIDPVMPPAVNGLRAQTTLLDRPIEVRYEVGPSGHGVSKVTLNGAALPRSHDANAYRRGAARVALDVVGANLEQSGNVLEVRLG
jgi:1,2-beta-oligoglucan phosphorylase